uniref:C-type lectin domain-containing protein n=1 Tax=Cyprinus carpio TaxID=7962 RepID=A0A8C1XTZ7_CYPCA
MFWIWSDVQRLHHFLRLISVFPSEMERITCMSLLLTAVVSSSAGAPRQYHFVNQTLNWTEAQRYCREHHTDLVTISDIQEQNDIEQSIKSSSDPVWIGLKSTDTWIWSLGDPAFYTEHESQFRNWGSKQPNGDGDCVYMDCVNYLKGQCYYRLYIIDIMWICSSLSLLRVVPNL